MRVGFAEKLYFKTIQLAGRRSTPPKPNTSVPTQGDDRAVWRASLDVTATQSVSVSESDPVSHRQGIPIKELNLAFCLRLALNVMAPGLASASAAFRHHLAAQIDTLAT